MQSDNQTKQSLDKATTSNFKVPGDASEKNNGNSLKDDNRITKIAEVKKFIS